MYIFDSDLKTYNHTWIDLQTHFHYHFLWNQNYITNYN